MKKLIIIALTLLLSTSLSFAGEKEELNYQLSALTWEMNYLQARAQVIQQQAAAISEKLRLIEAKEKETPKK